jgi:hypothetical protein
MSAVINLLEEEEAGVVGGGGAAALQAHAPSALRPCAPASLGAPRRRRRGDETFHCQVRRAWRVRARQRRTRCHACAMVTAGAAPAFFRTRSPFNAAPRSPRAGGRLPGGQPPRRPAAHALLPALQAVHGAPERGGAAAARRGRRGHALLPGASPSLPYTHACAPPLPGSSAPPARARALRCAARRAAAPRGARKQLRPHLCLHTHTHTP